MRSDDAPSGFTVFISDAHEDNESPDPGKRWLTRLLQHLQPLIPLGQIRPWSDTRLEAGELWDTSIKAQLRGADAAVLLLSPAFLASKYIRNSELPALLMNAMKEGRAVIPIMVRPCLFTETKFKYPDPALGPDELSLSVFRSANPLNKVCRFVHVECPGRSAACRFRVCRDTEAGRFQGSPVPWRMLGERRRPCER